MTQYNTLNVKLANLQLNKLKSGIKNRTEVTLNLSPNLTGNSNDETNFSHKLLLTNAQVSIICIAFANDSSTNIKFSKTQLSKMTQSGGILANLLGAISHTMFLRGLETLKGGVKKGVTLAKRAAPQQKV